VNQALAGVGLPVWGRARPATLVWLAVDDFGQRYLVGPQHEDIQAILHRLSRQRGVPLVMPLLDLEDQFKLGFADVWANFEESVQRASSRYGTEAVLVGRLLRSSENFWHGRWTLYHGGQVNDWESDGDIEDTLAAGIDSGADTLATRFARFVDAGGVQLRVRINEVLSIADYARVADYLGSMEAVESVRAVYIDAESIIFNVALRGDRNSLEQAVALSDRTVLTPEPRAVAGTPSARPGDTSASTAISADLSYRLLP
jgi:hypothetical protein